MKDNSLYSVITGSYHLSERAHASRSVSGLPGKQLAMLGDFHRQLVLAEALAPATVTVLEDVEIKTTLFHVFSFLS